MYDATSSDVLISPTHRLPRRRFLSLAVGSSAMVLLTACGSSAPAPAATKPAEAPKPTSAPAAPPAAASPAAGASPAAAASPAAGASPAAAASPAPSGSPAAKPAAEAKPQAPAVKPTMSKVRVLFNVPQDPTFVPDLSAYQRMKDEFGVECEVQEITGADASIKALIAGQAEFALSTLASGILAVGQSQAIKAAVPAAHAPYFTMVVTNDITDWKQLAGKRIGITATSDSSYYTTLLQLRKNGVDPNSIEWVTVRGVPARVDAMKAGKIDVSQVTVGAALELVKDPKFKRFAEIGKDFPNLLFSAYWVTNKMIQEHPTVVQAFADSLMQEHRNAQDKTKYMTNGKKFFEGKIDEATLSQSYDILKEMNIWDPNAARWKNEAGGEFTAKTLAEFEAVEKLVPFDQWATTQFSDAARGRLGEYKA